MDKSNLAAWGARDIIREFQPLFFEYPHQGKKIIASMRLTLDPLSRSETLIIGVLDVNLHLAPSHIDIQPIAFS